MIGEPDTVQLLADGSTLRGWDWVPGVGRYCEVVDQAGVVVQRIGLNLTGTSEAGLAADAADQRELDAAAAAPPPIVKRRRAVRRSPVLVTRTQPITQGEPWDGLCGALEALCDAVRLGG